jgi:DNA repair protein RadC
MPRPETRFAPSGRLEASHHFSDCELVQFVTRTKETEADDLLRKFGGASAVISASDSEMAAQGVNRMTARRIRAFQEAAAAYHWRKVAKRTALTSWNALLDYLSVGMAAKGTEEFHVVFLDRKNALLADEVLGKGTVDHAPVYPREVAKRALALDACAVILVHNHPSGDPTPSRGDIEMTREVVEACKTLRIAVHDHIVVGRDGTASFKALGLM